MQSNRSSGPPPRLVMSPAHCGQRSPKALKPSSQPLAQESLYSCSQAGVRPTRTGQGVRVLPQPPPSPQAPAGLTATGLGPAHPSNLTRPLPALPAWALGWAYKVAVVPGRPHSPPQLRTTSRGRPGCAKVRQSLRGSAAQEQDTTKASGARESSRKRPR